MWNKYNGKKVNQLINLSMKLVLKYQYNNSVNKNSAFNRYKSIPKAFEKLSIFSARKVVQKLSES